MSVPQARDEPRFAEQLADEVRWVALVGPALLGGLLAHSVYRSTCDGQSFYAEFSGPAHAYDIWAVAMHAIFMWKIPEPVPRSGFAILLVSQAIRWRWTFTGIPSSQTALWVAYLVSASLLTIAAVRDATIRHRALTVGLFVLCFAAAWYSHAWRGSHFDLRSVLHSASWC
jgi:hypothetical protein